MASVARPVPSDDIGIELVRDWVPDATPRAHIVLVHGIVEHCGRYERTGSLLAEAGFRALLRPDRLWRIGRCPGDIDEWSRYHDQIQGHMEWAREQGTAVVLMGHSMGGTWRWGMPSPAAPPPTFSYSPHPPWPGRMAARSRRPGAKVAPTVARPPP